MGVNVSLIKPAFTKQRTDEEQANDRYEVFTVRMNKAEYSELQEAKRLLMQEKDSTALKQLAELGASFVLHDQKTRLVLETVINNRRKNERLGVPMESPQYAETSANVTQNNGGL
jgi:dihydroorotase-like cyclic amidohydrolase